MNKILWIAITVAIVVIAYLIMIVVMPIVADFAATANTTINASSNMSDYPGTSGFLLSIPWILWFVPAVGGIIGVIAILKSE